MIAGLYPYGTFAESIVPIRKGDRTVNQLSRNLALWLLLILMVLLLVNVFTKQPARDQEMIFSDFLSAVDKGEVTEVTVQGQDLHGKKTSGEAFRTFAPPYPELISDLRAKGVRIDARREDPEPFWYVARSSTGSR